MKKTLEKYPLFLLLLPVFVVIHLEKELHGLINYKFVAGRIAVFFIVPLVGWLISFAILRNNLKACFLAFGFSVFFFFLGDTINWLNEKYPDSLVHRYSFLLPLTFLLLVLLFLLLRKAKAISRPLIFFINAAMILFILADISIILTDNNKSRYHMRPVSILPETTCDSCAFPDIYYIIFDAYTSPAMLEKEFGYSNNSFYNNLSEEGFRMVKGSKSNYNYTAFSLSSIFNMNYFKNADTSSKIHDREYLQALKTVYHNEVFSFFEKQGYSIYNHSLFNIKNHPTTRNKKDMWGVRELFDQYNILLKFNYDAGYHLPAWLNKALLKNDFFVNDIENRRFIDSMEMKDLLNTIHQKSTKPKFAYAHFLTTHPPFYLDSLGNELKNLPGQPGDYNPENYIQQVARSNRMIRSLVDSVKSNTTRPLIIIIQGDHGYTFETDPRLKQTRMFHNLNAIYFSNQNYSMISDTMTSVNTFRVVLNTWFKKDLPILQNEFYFIK